MKIISRCGVFADALRMLSGLNDKGEELFLNRVLIEKQDDSVRVSVHGRGLEMRHTFSPDPDGLFQDGVNGACLIDFKRLLGVISSYDPQESLSLSADSPDFVTLTVGGEGLFRFRQSPVEAFPESQHLEATVAVRLPQEELSRGMSLIKHCQPSSTRKDSRTYLNGMLFDFQPDALVLVASDARSLGLFRAPITTDSPYPVITSCIVSNDHTNFIVGKLKRMLGEITITADTRLIRISNGITQISCNVVDAQYPDYHRVIPMRGENRVVLDLNQSITLFERIKLMSQQDINGVIMELEPDRLTLKSYNPDVEEGVDSIWVEYVGAPLKVGVNADIMQSHMESLRKGGWREVEMSRTQNAEASLLLQPAREDAEFLFVVSPMKL